MTIEKQLEVLKKALESGATVQLSYYAHVDEEPREKAEELIAMLEVQPEFAGNQGVYWVSGKTKQIRVTGFYQSA